MRIHARGAAPLVLAGAVSLAVTPMLTSTMAAGAERLVAQIALLDNEGWIMSGTGVPVPPQDYLDNVKDLYLSQYVGDGYNFTGLTTPEEFWPVAGNLKFADSLNQGLDILNGAVLPQLNDGDNVTVLGFSQSAVIATLQMQQLLANPPSDPDYDPANLHYVLLGDPNNQLGGILTRFQFPDGIGPYFSSIPQHVPFLDIPLNIGAAPTGPFETDVYSGFYDGWANFPQDPTNLLAVINALVGIGTVHPYYPFPAPGVNLDTDNIIDLGTIGQTTFHMIPAPLPLLAFMYDGGPVGRIFYDMFAPGMALNINWAYGNPGDPFVGVNGMHEIGPWAVNASGDLMPSEGAGFFMAMDPLQMLAGMQYAGVQSFIDPINGILNLAFGGLVPADISTFMTDLENSMLGGYDFTNELDQYLLTGWQDLATQWGVADTLGPDAIFDGGPVVSADPLIDLVGWGFNIFNLFGA